MVTSMTEHTPLVSTDWLSRHLTDSNVCIVDGTVTLPTSPKSGPDRFADAHIPEALFFDIDDIADQSVPLPHMVPSAETFAAKVGDLGIGNDTHVVAYDADGQVSATRVWWMFRLFGHDRVSVLDGGLPKWIADGYPVTSASSEPELKTFAAVFNAKLLARHHDIAKNINTHTFQLLDARAADRFEGTVPEIRPGLPSGHIPGSRNLPFASLLNPDDKTFRTPDEIRIAFAEAGINLEGSVTTTCGSGVTACVLAFAAHMLGKTDVAVYDGSWTEWAGLDGSPVETGAVQK